MDYSNVFNLIIDYVQICFPIAFFMNMAQLLINMLFSSAFGGKLKITTK